MNLTILKPPLETYRDEINISSEENAFHNLELIKVLSSMPQK